jgi:mRNA interferase RelE/StbE
MATYRITFKPTVEKDLSKVPRELIARFFKRLEILKQNPYPRQALRLEGTEGLYRLRVGDYRIIYGVHTTSHQIVVHHIRLRRDVYRDLS